MGSCWWLDEEPWPGPLCEEESGTIDVWKHIAPGRHTSMIVHGIGSVIGEPLNRGSAPASDKLFGTVIEEPCIRYDPNADQTLVYYKVRVTKEFPDLVNVNNFRTKLRLNS